VSQAHATALLQQKTNRPAQKISFPASSVFAEHLTFVTYLLGIVLITIQMLARAPIVGTYGAAKPKRIYHVFIQDCRIQNNYICKYTDEYLTFGGCV